MKRWALLLTITLAGLYLAICIAGLILRAPYWGVSPNVAPDFMPHNTLLMWAALALFPVSLIAIVWQAYVTRHFADQRQTAVNSSIALLSTVTLSALIFHPAPMSGFYEPSYCLHNQKAVYSEILSFAKSHHGRLPNSLSELPAASSSVSGCVVRTAWFLPPVRKPSALNNAIVGKTLAEIPNPHNVVLLADSLSTENLHHIHDIDWGRHDNACVVIFCDGHGSIYKAKDQTITLDPWHAK